MKLVNGNHCNGINEGFVSDLYLMNFCLFSYLVRQLTECLVYGLFYCPRRFSINQHYRRHNHYQKYNLFNIHGSLHQITIVRLLTTAFASDGQS